MRSPKTSDELPQLVPTLKTDSEHEEVLLKLFALHRIATPYDVMNVFPHYFKYHNRTMRHLNWLGNKGYLRRHRYRDGYVYNITNAGYVRCRDFMDLNRIPYRYEEPAGKQVEHELLITKTGIAICQYLSLTPGLQLLDHGRFMLGEVFEDKVPDYWYVCRDSNGLMVRFIEAIVGEESPTRIRNTIEEYEPWALRDDVKEFLIDLYRRHGAKDPLPEFQVHCILESTSWKYTDSWKERMTMMQTFHVNPAMQGRVWTTTKEALETAIAEGGNINHPIWHRGKDLLGDIRNQFRGTPEGRRTRFFDEYMRRLPTYPLFA